MTEEQYIRRIIRKYTPNDQALSYSLNTAKQLYPLIRKWAIPLFRSNAIPYSAPRIRPIGSYSKGTNIIGVTDIDLFISFSSQLPYSLHDIYYSLLNHLKNINLYPKEQNVSIKIEYNNISIDLVPAKKQPQSVHDHSIYSKRTGFWIKTNIHKHIRLIKNSYCRNEIKAIKIWRKLHKLEFPSFYLELSVLNALRGYRKIKISTNFMRIFKYLYNEIEHAKIIDPSNSNNIISDDLDNSEKRAIADMAYSSFTTQSWEQIIW